jgi:alkaline phosphatase
MSRSRARLRRLLAVVAILAAPVSIAAGGKKVILMVVDGAGYNTWKATAMYEGTVGAEFHDEPGWVEVASSVHALRQDSSIPVGSEHGSGQAPHLVYDPARAWDKTPVPGEKGGYAFHFAGYQWLRETFTDSANTITTLVTGKKTYVGAINVDGDGEPIRETIAWLAKDHGMKVGVVTSVQWSHATPAGAGGAHAANRGTYCEIAVEMLTSPVLDFVAGCGHPDFDNNGRPIEDPDRKIYRYVGGKKVWDQLTGTAAVAEGEVVCSSAGRKGVTLTREQVEALRGWKLEQSRRGIGALRKGKTPSRLLIVPRVGQIGFRTGRSSDPARRYPAARGGTLQQQRGSRADPRYTEPGYDPPVKRVPTLETLTRVALNALDDDDAGFFLHVEGGAVDWAMHDNQMGRMLEEMIDFKRSIAAVVEWADRNDAWDDTLVIVTSDHDHLLWGPRSDTIPFDPIRDNGAGKMPSYRWLYDSHTNQLVPVYARGAGADRLTDLADLADPFRGNYLDQADIFEVMKTVITAP